MTGLIKEEILTTIKKKRFIILMPLVYIGAIVMTVITKNRHWNDLTYFLAIQDYILKFFNPAAGSILLLSLYRRKYTKTSIQQVEDHGMKRSAGVLARTEAGCIILFCCYAVMALFIILTGLIFGAHLTSVQTGQLALRLLTDFLAAAAGYVFAQFWLYLFAFPAVPIILYIIVIMIAPVLYKESIGYYANLYYWVCALIFPKMNMDLFYSSAVLSGTRWEYLLFLIAQAAVPFLLTLLVFKLKKKERKKRKKKGEEPAEETPESVQEEPAPEAVPEEQAQEAVPEEQTQE